MSFSTFSRKALSAAAVGAFMVGTAYAAGPHEAPMQDFANSTVKTWISNPVIVDAIKAQNAKHASLGQADIDSLDKQWRAETGASSRPMIESVLANAVSQFLADAKNQQQGLVTEIFVMDNKGLNVGQSDVTSDYWQGDEAKFKKSYMAGPNAVFIDEVEQDESTQAFQSQLSMSVVDPATGEVIGAITVGMNVESMM